jgi:hypothetical protein
MSLVPDPGTFGVAAKADITAAGANAVPTDTAPSEFLDFSTADSPAPRAGTLDEDVAEFFSFDEDTADLFTLEDAPEDVALSTATPDIRSITPRRPMRFTFARDSMEHSRLILPIPNLFENTFEDDTLNGPGIDPRLQRSRARARARLMAHEAALPPEARNLWYDDGSDDQTPAASDTPLDTEADSATITLTETAASDGTDGHAPRRAVRHLSVTRRAPKPRLAASEIHDPLQSHLHQVREALYTPDPEEAAAALAAPPQQTLPLRLVAVLVTLTVLLMQIIAAMRASLPDSARALRDTLLANSLRLPSRALAITGMILAIAQTIPPNLM